MYVPELVYVFPFHEYVSQAVISLLEVVMGLISTIVEHVTIEHSFETTQVIIETPGLNKPDASLPSPCLIVDVFISYSNSNVLLQAPVPLIIGIL